MLLLCLVGGIVADQLDRRKVLIVVQSSLALVSARLAYSTITESVTLWEIYALVACWGAIRAFDSPSRGAMLPTLVPIEHLPSAVSINSVGWRLSDVAGPLVVTFALWFNGVSILGHEASGVGLVYLVNTISFIPVLFALCVLPSCGPDWSDGEDKKIRNLRQVFPFLSDGFRFTFQTKIVRDCMLIDFLATFFSTADALLPFVIVNILNETKEAYGLLPFSIAVGSLAASLFMAFRAVPKRPGSTIVLAVAVYGLCTLGLAFSPWLPASMLLLAGTGAADTVSTVLRQTVRQLATPDAYRGRMTAVGALFQIGGPQLGDFEAGLMARYTGERFAIAFGGAACCAVSWLYWRVRTFRDYRLPAR